MGVFNAFKRDSRGGFEGDVTPPSTRPRSYDTQREVTLEDGLNQLLQTVEGLVALEHRVAELENDLIGSSPVALQDLPSPAELGIDGLVPRLMETSLLLGALSRRMHLRMGVIEGALGIRAKPTAADLEPLPTQSPAKAAAFAAQAAPAALTNAGAADEQDAMGPIDAASDPSQDGHAAGAVLEASADTRNEAATDAAKAVIAALAEMKSTLAARRAKAH